MHLNRECRYSDLSNLFVLDEVTEAINDAFADIGALVTEFTEILLQDGAPDIPIGAHCTRPYECPFKAHCWSDVAAAKSAESRILWPAIAEALRELTFPLFFLDFETMAEPVPRQHGLGPYRSYPFQYSLHVMHLDGTLEHREYLHPDGSDPRAPLAEQLLSDITGEGTIVAYNASFEKRVISDLATHLPRLRGNLRSLLPRFFDLLPIFRDFSIHPEFRGSASIKDVLPVLVPELTYATLEVQSGDVAQVDRRIYEVLLEQLRSMGLPATC